MPHKRVSLYAKDKKHLILQALHNFTLCFSLLKVVQNPCHFDVTWPCNVHSFERNALDFYPT